MKNYGLATAFLALLALIGCGSGADAPPPDGGGGVENPYNGRLIAEGTAMIHDMDLTGNGPWTKRLQDTVYATFNLHLPGNELLLAKTSFGSDLTVEFYDLDTFALTDTFVWPDSTSLAYGRIGSIAISTDGAHLAATITGGQTGSEFLEIVNRQTKEVVFSDRLGMEGFDMQWLTEDMLVFAANLGDTQFAGGIVTAYLTNLASDDPQINLDVFVGFTADEWAVDSPRDFAFSHDYSQMVYSWNGAIWVNELDDQPSHQLTTGPSGLVGPVFSPDGQNIAFVEFAPLDQLQGTYVIPNHRAEPLFVNGDNPALTEAFLLEDRTLIDTMLVWED